jgi:F-type H+-transporting ATPase subunit gamma
MTQEPQARLFAPLEVIETEASLEQHASVAAYDFEPSAEEMMADLLPRYMNTRIYAALLESAASESAARRRAMKAATDNANELTKGLVREANQARQAEITQEISEIVGGADALAASGGSKS